MKYVSMVPVDDLWAIYRTDNEDGSESYAKTRVLFAAISEEGVVTLIDGFFTDIEDRLGFVGVVGNGVEFATIDPASAESAELERLFRPLRKAAAQ